jgi:hypothetical protein
VDLLFVLHLRQWIYTQQIIDPLAEDATQTIDPLVEYAKQTIDPLAEAVKKTILTHV